MENSVKQRMNDDLKTAMRAGDTATRDAIRYILAGLKNAEIDHRGSSEPFDEIPPLRKLGKQMTDSAAAYRDAGRLDLAEKEEHQLAVLNRYLPAGLDDAALAALASEVVAEVGAKGPKDMGKVMPVLIERVAGLADGRRINAAAKDALAAAAAS